GIVGQLFEVEDFAHRHAHDGNGDPVPRLVDALFAFVRPHLAAPSIAGEGCEFRALDPVQRLESEARRIAAGIAVPASRLPAAFHHAGAYDNEIATFDCNTLFARGLVEVGAGDAVTVIKGVDGVEARHVKQHAAADHLVLSLLDAAFLRARARPLATIVAVPHVIFVEHVTEPVPLGTALQRHRYHVVGGTDAAFV